MNQALIVGLGLASAFAFAVSTNLKHGSASVGPDLPSLRPRPMLRFVRATLRHPLWLLGTVADLVGLVLQVIALHFGAIAVVQPLLATGLLFALALRAIHRRHVRASELVWAVLLAGSLGGFLAVAGPSPGAVAGEGVDRLPAAVAGAVGLIGALGLVAVARRLPPAAGRATLLGISVGITYAANAALLKTCTDRYAGGLGSLLASWQLYAVIVVGAAGLFLCQLAYEAGPLTASQPAMSAVDPLASVIIGVLIFDERLRRGPFTGLIMVGLVLLLAVSIVGLARMAVAETDRGAAG